MKGSLLALFALLAALSGVASAQAGPDSSQAVWWASRAAGENWLLERTIVTRVDCGPPACDTPQTLQYRSTVDSATCRGRGQHWRSRGVTYWHLFRCQVEATPLETDALVPDEVELKPTGKNRFAYRVTSFFG
jgi:hypothetical protein